VVLKVDLHNLVGESEHDGMSRPHPLLNVDDLFYLSEFLSVVLSILLHQALWLVVTLKITPEMLKECNLLLEFLRVFC
jgi:hypothetical protein